MEVLPDDRSRWSSESPSFVPFRTKASRHPRPGAFVLSIRVDASSAPHPAPSPPSPSPAPVIVTVNGTGENHYDHHYHHQKYGRQDVSVTTPTVKVVSEVVRVPPKKPEAVSEIRVLPTTTAVSRVPVEPEESTSSDIPDGRSEVKMVLPVVQEFSTATVVPVGPVTLEVPAEPMVTDVSVVSEVRVQTPVSSGPAQPMVMEVSKTSLVAHAESRASPESPRRAPERVLPLVVEERTYEDRLKGSLDAEDEVDGEMHFHLNVERGEAAVRKGLGRSGTEESTGALLLPGAVGTIRSSRGTVRGVRNRVRAGIQAFLQNETSQGYRDKERGKVVLYTTSMGVVRRTFHKCLRVKQILRTLLVPFEERDASTSAAVREEIQRRLGTSTCGDGVTQSSSPPLPQLFVEGQYVGDAEEIERLNETGELRRMLKPFQNPDAAWTCNTCGGYQRLPCAACGGSKRSLLRNAFTEEFVALRCMVCDESGLVRCSNCT